MKIEANTPDEYASNVQEAHRQAFKKLRETVRSSIPEGFEEQMSYGMIGYVVPHSMYPQGYHVNPELPLPFVNIASQKNYIALYHSGIYADEELLKWFESEYPKHSPTKLDMGKSCIRFKKPENIPFELIGELLTKVTPQAWIERYESNVKS